jgi:hypothetical protein
MFIKKRFISSLIFLLLLFNITSAVMAQATAADSVKAAIQQLFKGMQNADTALLRNAFADQAILQTVVSGRDGHLTVRSENLDEFISFVGQQNPGDADERIEWDVIRIDGPLASAWTPYHFFYKSAFSHCGVNSFQLVRIGGNWKIQYLIDTRRREPCKD